MKFIIERDILLKSLQKIIRSLVNRPVLPILENILLKVTKKGYLLLISTDLEIEIIDFILLDNYSEIGTTTVHGKKFFSIFKGFPEKSKINVTLLENNRILLCSGTIKFFISTLPSFNFPNLDKWIIDLEFTVSQAILKKLIELTSFSMANQDVRHYLNGMLFETIGEELRTVTSDGHRLAYCSILLNKAIPSFSVIIPRKGVLEIIRILDENSENLIKLQIGSNHIRAIIGNYIFTTKVVEGQFPNYKKIFPKHPDKLMEVDSDLLKQALYRSSIISNDNWNGVRLYLSMNKLKITTNNSMKEESEEILDVIYQGSPIEIGINVNYILDVLSVLKCRKIRFLLTDGISSIQIEDCTNKTSIYIVMPMYL